MHKIAIFAFEQDEWQDLANDEARSTLISFLPSADKDDNVYVPQPFPMELRDVTAMVPSRSGRWGLIMSNFASLLHAWRIFSVGLRDSNGID